MEERHEFSCGIIGGGLAGLCLAIQLAEQGIAVILFEKNHYPFHKVCGEYISMESYDFLQTLGVPLDALGLPRIGEVHISSEKGFVLSQKLDLGGFGISRYSLDHYLSRIAVEKGVTVMQGCRVSNVQKVHAEGFQIETSAGTFRARVVCGSYGKYTPAFVGEADRAAARGTSYIGVKYHIQGNIPADRIELHNFRDGYCGISKVDQDWYCLCYLSKSSNLLSHGKDIRKMEEEVLWKNPFLKKYFTESTFVNRQPLVISNIQFGKKQSVSAGMFLLGDAAGTITPLCGNGMSMSMHASRLLAEELIPFFAGQQSALQAAARYRHAWNSTFSRRITAGYYLQGLFGKRELTDAALRVLSKTPGITRKLIGLTHGSRF